MKLIRSVDNPLVRRVLGLRDSARERREEARTVIEGAHLVEAYLDHAIEAPDVVVVSQASSVEPDIARLLERVAGATLVCLDDRVFGKLSPVAGRNGILAIIAAAGTPLADAVGGGGFQLWLDAVQDPGNVGSLIRSAAASGAGAVVLGPGCADPGSPKCLRGGMGGHFSICVAQATALEEAARTWQGRILVAAANAGDRVFSTDLVTGDVAVVLGGEGAGVQPALVARATGMVGIPMPGDVESLNVGAAGAVICFERLRQALSKAGH
jgi:TrmH family RNA methyltransferase